MRISLKGKKNVMNDLQKLQNAVEKIKVRNRRVELDKAWETSLMRKVVILCLTYVVTVLFFFAAGFPNPFLNAIVPSLGFFLSTLTVPVFKQWWMKKK